MTMRITAADEIAGLPAFEARALLRHAVRWGRFTASHAASRLDQPPRRVARVLRRLADAGLLQLSAADERPVYGGDIGPAWEASQQGYRLAHATAAKPIQRATAERLLAEVVARAEVLRDVARHSYAFTVARLVVFGSFLTDVPTLGDLDISVAWAPRLPERNAQYTYTRERIALARREWRQFSNMSEEFAWPHVEVARFLRGRSRAVSLHDHDEEPDFIAGIPHRVLL